MDVKTKKVPMVAALLAVLWAFGAPADAEASLPLDAPSSRVFKNADPFATAPQLDLPSLTEQLRAVEERRAAASECVSLCELAAGIDAHPFGVAAADPPNRSEDAWGNYRFTSELAPSKNRFGYTGHYWDKEASLYYAKARYYDPFTARFTQSDSFLGNIDDPPSLHRYFYAHANPTMFTDPTGYASRRPQRVTTAEGYSIPIPQDGDYTEVHADPIKQIEYEFASGQRDRAGAFAAAMDVYQEPTTQIIAVGALPSAVGVTLLTGGPVAAGGFVIAGTMSVGRQTSMEKRSLAQVDYARVHQEGIFGAILGRLGQLGLASRNARIAHGTRVLGYGASAAAVGSGAGHTVEGFAEGDASKAAYGLSEMALGGAGILSLKQVNPRTGAPNKGSPLGPNAKGDLAKGWSREAATARGDRIFGEEVDLVFRVNGKDVGVRADVLVKPKEGGDFYVYVESKYSGRAPFTEHQQIVVPELVKSGDNGLYATVGSRSGLLQPGQRIKVQFQGDVWDAKPTLRGQ